MYNIKTWNANAQGTYWIHIRYFSRSSYD